MLLFTLSLARANAPPTCVEPAPPERLAAVVAAAETAFRELEMVAFEARVVEANGILPCVDAVLSPALAAAFHRMEGIAAFSRRDLKVAEEAFAAARLVDPDYIFPTDLIGPDHPILSHYIRRDLSALPVRDLPLPPDTAIWVDGVRSNRVYGALPHVVQIQQLETRTYVWDSSAAVFQELEDRPEERPTSSRRRGRLVRVVIGSGFLAGAALSQVVGFVRYEQLVTRPPVDWETKVRSNQRVANATTWALGIGGAGLVVSGAF